MLASSVAPAPWQHASELALIRDWFYPSHASVSPFSVPPPDNRQAAVHQVHMWAFKDPALPHAVLATAQLTDATLHDSPAHYQLLSGAALRAIYAVAFARFVTGVVDRDQVKEARKFIADPTSSAAGDADVAAIHPQSHPPPAITVTHSSASSMRALARRIGMPVRFVEARHRIVHGAALPELAELRVRVAEALEWLYQRWWRVHAGGEPARAVWELEERARMAEKKREEKRRMVEVETGAEQRLLLEDRREITRGKADETMNIVPVSPVGIDAAAEKGPSTSKRSRASLVSKPLEATEKTTAVMPAKRQRKAAAAFGLFDPT